MELKMTIEKPTGLASCIALLVSTALMFLSISASGYTEYRVDLSERDVQQVNIEVRFNGVTGKTLDFHLPTWRSGQYLVIDPVGTMSGIEVIDGNGSALDFRQTAKSSWRVERPTGVADDVVVRYRIYADSLNDRTRHVDSEHAFLNPAAVFIYGVAAREGNQCAIGARGATGRRSPRAS